MAELEPLVEPGLVVGEQRQHRGRDRIQQVKTPSRSQPPRRAPPDRARHRDQRRHTRAAESAARVSPDRQSRPPCVPAAISTGGGAGVTRVPEPHTASKANNSPSRRTPGHPRSRRDSHRGSRAYGVRILRRRKTGSQAGRSPGRDRRKQAPRHAMYEQRAPRQIDQVEDEQRKLGHPPCRWMRNRVLMPATTSPGNGARVPVVVPLVQAGVPVPESDVRPVVGVGLGEQLARRLRRKVQMAGAETFPPSRRRWCSTSATW